MGTSQPTFIEGSTRAWRAEQGSRHAISEQCPLRRVDAPPTKCSGNLGDLLQGRGRPLCLNRFSYCQTYFFKSKDALAHEWPNHLYAFPPIALIPQVIRRVSENRHRVLLVAPLWRNHHWISELSQLFITALWPNPLRWDLLSQGNKNSPESPQGLPL